MRLRWWAPAAPPLLLLLPPGQACQRRVGRWARGCRGSQGPHRAHHLLAAVLVPLADLLGPRVTGQGGGEAVHLLRVGRDEADTRGTLGPQAVASACRAGSAAPRRMHSSAAAAAASGGHAPPHTLVLGPPLTRRAVCGLSWAWPPRPCRGRGRRRRGGCGGCGGRGSGGELAEQVPLPRDKAAAPAERRRRGRSAPAPAAARGAAPAGAHARRNCCGDWGRHWAARP
jgi:hypothetical protein